MTHIHTCVCTEMYRPIGSAVTVIVVGGPLRRSIFPSVGEHEKLGSDGQSGSSAAVKPQ